MPRVVRRERLVPNIHLLEVEAPEISRKCRPGQFVIVMPRRARRAHPADHRRLRTASAARSRSSFRPSARPRTRDAGQLLEVGDTLSATSSGRWACPTPHREGRARWSASAAARHRAGPPASPARTRKAGSRRRSASSASAPRT
ncbi:MAG: hypothetical protein MZU95_04560 [Desulfomicrobium escambiense]|nr:hypothetical protein [Desulfomicrobium escambiense]